MVRIRLQRHGRKQRAFYYIVAADQRAPRDGRYIERIGSYNPNTNPATIDLDLDASVRWLQNGAVPTDTCRAILSYKGALYKNHLLRGVTKGALSEEEANKKFDAWVESKSGLIDSKREQLAKAKADAEAEAFKREEEIRIAREKAIAEKNAPEGVAEDAAEASAEGSEVAETAADESGSEAAPEAQAEETAPEAKAEEAEAPKEEAAPEAKAEEAEAPKEEAAPEAKAEEAEESKEEK
ncbi:30S ribosomal protein S16 [bacterium]|nr:30S ribosomal protein S16 [bacterium]